MQGLQTLDWIVISLYFSVLFGIALWVVKQKQKDTTDYFLAGRHIAWFVIGASIFASNIGSEHIVGLAGTAAKSGVAMGHYELHAWCVLLLGWVFVPFYMRSKVFTMPEFLEMRYSPTARWFLSLISLVAYVLTKVSVTIYAGLKPLEIPAVLVAGHGPFTWGKTPSKSVENSLILEKVAKMALRALQINPELNRLPEYILKKHYQRKHGPDAYYGQKKKGDKK